MYLPLHCHHQNDFCIKMGSDESHFNVSLIVRDTHQRGPSAYQPTALPLGQTGSLTDCLEQDACILLPLLLLLLLQSNMLESSILRFFLFFSSSSHPLFDSSIDDG